MCNHGLDHLPVDRNMCIYYLVAIVIVKPKY